MEIEICSRPPGESSRWSPVVRRGGVAAQTPALAQRLQHSPRRRPRHEVSEAIPPPEFKLVLEPRAMDLLKATCAKLAAAKSMSFTATVSYEYPSELGPPIVYTTRYDVAMQRPDKLKVVMPGDGPASEFYYDGKEMMAYAPAENLVAVADAPPTIDAALEAAIKRPPSTIRSGSGRRRPLCGVDRRGDPRILCRSVRNRGWHEDGHGGLGQRRCVPADLDRRRRQAAASHPRRLPQGPIRAGQ